MSHEAQSWTSLSGSLLLADPALQDPNFNRTVLLLTDHRREHGAHGYVMNRPLGRTVGDLLPGAEFAPLASTPVMIGGPVSQEHLTFAAFAWQARPARLSWTTHLTVEDAVRRAAAGEAVRAFVGYAGWTAGQLEEELGQRAWITASPHAAVLRDGGAGRMWHDILHAMGPYYRLIADTPEDPSLN